MAARNKPAGIRSLVYGISKGKARIEGLSVSGSPTLSINKVNPKIIDRTLGNLVIIWAWTNSITPWIRDL